MDNLLLIKVLSLIEEEYNNSLKKFPLFNSPHEGYAVILEELDELWNEVKKKQFNKVNSSEECIQIAAMCAKFILSLQNF